LPKDGLEIANVPRKIVKASVLTGGTVKVTQNEDKIAIRVAPEHRAEIVTLVKLELDGSAMDLALLPIAPPSLTFGKKAAASNVFQNDKAYAAEKALDENPSTRWATDSGTHSAWLQVDLGAPTLIARTSIQEAYAGRVRKFELQYREDEKAEWRTALAGTEIGEPYAKDFPAVTARFVRLNILEATEGPTLHAFRLHSL
jgi:alpha-L-fucosidase